MKSAPFLTIRRGLTALACTAALVPLAACQGDDITSPAADNKASYGAGREADNAGRQAKPNGIEKHSAKEIYNKGHQENADAGSFREVTTSTVHDSDVRVSESDCVGTVSKKDMGSWEIIRKGSEAWVKADRNVGNWIKNQGGGEIPTGKWMHGTPTHPLLRGMLSYCHHEQFTAPDKASIDLTKGKVKAVAAVPAIPLVNEPTAGKSLTFYVATTGKPYLVRREVKGRDDLPTITYTDFGKSVGAKAPTADVVEAPSA
ncbi:hypothetical protein [Streptomyces chryseus]